MTLLDHIPYGRANAISRSDLCRAAGLPDRLMRREIEALRRSGEIIINNQDGSGYYRPTDLQEIERYLRQETARGLSILKTAAIARRKLMGIEGQIGIGDAP